MNFLQAAENIKSTIIENRRFLHRHPEIGFDTNTTREYVKSQLESYGLYPQELGKSGLVCCIGKAHNYSDNVILLRADMDALPMQEDSGLEFASQNAGRAHCCGHDNHTAMLLGAAQLLKEHEDELPGTVKLMFQSAEEIGQGAQDMIDSGLLRDPEPQAVLALHVNAKSPLGYINYGKGYTFASTDNFTIVIHGVSCHAARPFEGVNPIEIFSHLYQQFESLKTTQASPSETIMLSVATVHAGDAHNVVPSTLEAKGTLRTYNASVRTKLKQRMQKVCSKLAELYDIEIDLKFSDSLPPLLCSDEFTDEILGYIRELVGADRVSPVPEMKMGSDDFAFVTEHYPDSSAYIFVGAGPDVDTPYEYGQHNPKVIFNEDMLPIGTAILAHSAMSWLKHRASE